MKELLFFETMITPRIITFIYWLLLFAAVVSGIGSMFFGRMSFGGFVTGVGIIVGGAIGARVWCELLIVLFKINEHTQKLAEKP